MEIGKNMGWMLAARGTFTGTGYSEVLNWESAQYLWQKLNANRNLLGQDALIDSFYQAAQSDYLSRSFEVKWNSIEMEAISQLSNTLDSLLNLGNFEQVEDLRIALAQQRKDLNTRLRNDIINQAQVNRSITTSNRFLAYEIFLNQLYTSYLLDSALKLESSDAEQLYSIASLCPREEGRMVYRARALYNLMVEQARFDDDLLCELPENRANRTTSKLLQMESASLKMYPNPANNEVVIEVNDFFEDQSVIQVLNFSGKMVKNISISNKRSVVNLEGLPSGVYFVTLRRKGTAPITQKLVIINN